MYPKQATSDSDPSGWGAASVVCGAVASIRVIETGDWDIARPRARVLLGRAEGALPATAANREQLSGNANGETHGDSLKNTANAGF